MYQKKFTDQLNREIQLPFPPKRIVSLVPSQTELLSDLELDTEVVGITKFCVWPSSWKQSKTNVGGTKSFRLDVIDQLEPDLIIANKEENCKEGIEELMHYYPVWLSDVTTFDQALEMILAIGKITGREEKSIGIVRKIQMAFDELPAAEAKRVLYLIWKKPWMAAGRNTFINSLLGKIGFENCISDSRYPIISEELIRQLNPEIIFLSSEPYPFQQNHVKELSSKHPRSRVRLVDGEYFSWFGSRMLGAPAYFCSILK